MKSQASQTIRYEADQTSDETVVQDAEAEQDVPRQFYSNDSGETPSDGGEATADGKFSSSAKTKVKQFFSARKIATLGMFTALSFAISLLDFPIFPQASFLKLDFSLVFVMLMGFAFGPVEAVIVLVIKELLRIPLGSTGGIGELANMIMGFGFILIPSVAYYFKKGLKVVIPTLIAGIILQTAAALVCNRYITFPLYMGSKAQEYFDKLYYFVIFFNLIKGAAISVLCVVMYKYLSKALKKLQIK